MRLITTMSCKCCLLLLPVCITQATEQAHALASEARMPGVPPHWSGESTEDFHANCPGFDEPTAERGIRGGFTRQCETRLDQKFLNEIPLLTPITANDSTLTWRHVFDEPLTKRKIVLEALNDPTCRSDNLSTDANEVEQLCNAAEIADFAVLKFKCGGNISDIQRFIANGISYPWWLNLYHRVFESDTYWQRRWGVENAYFRHAWIAAKCAGVPKEAFESLGVFENTMVFGGAPQPGEEHWWWAEQGFEAYKLMEIAGRLSSNLTRTEYGYEPESISSWQRVQPVMAELLKFKDPGNYSNAAEEKKARLKHFIAIKTWMKIRRTEVSENWLLEQVGEFSDEELNQAADDANSMMAKQEADGYRH